MNMDERNSLTEEKLAEMRARAQMMEDELHEESTAEFKATGRLSSATLCEKTVEYENYLLTIEKIEKLLRTTDEPPDA